MPHARPHERKKAPKRVLARPDLEHPKSAVLSSLTSRSGSAPTTTRFGSSSRGTAPSHVLPSTARWSSGNGFTLNSGSTRPRRSTSVWPPFVAWRTRRPTLGS